MNKIRILCYGDSNTWGFISGSDHMRYGDTERWPKVLANLLGDKYEIIEEGLNGRTLISNDPRQGKEGRNGYQYLIPCLKSHDPLDCVVIMLGSNELQPMYNRTIEEIGELFEQYFVETILNSKSQFNETSPKLLIVAPPLVNENNNLGIEPERYMGAGEKSTHFNDMYHAIALKYECPFISNEGLETGPDGLHLTLESHKELANRVKKEIEKLF